VKRRLRAFKAVYDLSRWARRRFTPAGLAVLYLMAAAAVFGIDTQRTAAYQVFGLAVGLVALASLGAMRLRARPSITRALPDYATVGQPFPCRYRIANTSPHALRDLRLRDELADDLPTPERFRDAAGDGEAGVNWIDRRIGYPRWVGLVSRARGADLEEVALPDVGPRGSGELVASITPLRRGLLRFEHLRLLRADPLGLINAIATLRAADTLLVLPRIHPLPPIALSGRRRLQQGGVALSQHVGDSEEFSQLRDYRAGDPLRHIHWRAFARTGKPVVKEFQDEYFTRYALVLDTFCAPAAAADFEAALSVAASVLTGLPLREALLDLLFVEDRAWCLTAGRGVGNVAELLRVVAVLEPSRQVGFETLAHRVLLQAHTLSACIVVLLGLDTARRRLLEQLAAAGVEVLALVVGAAAEVPGVRLHTVDPHDVGVSLAGLACD
jgi:uncharacterized protein (DUF58 family)